ncbi:hypothetical protein D1B31_12355 [Neobacillus notoginsengisoli]|uniref:Hsp20/alpha crystallin family protein n=1 Tax=Neobacillus notoginsengisoli TaxID=1578198 RepID=A0A417YTF3_9BACI|nr:hypothetical protein [Neobacillus notoginsengisoli]RHW40337.1 hypothetical protein D1B31_12355 [Neobacillus notoginsengisoli]
MLPFPFSKGGLPKWLDQSYFNNDIQKFVQDLVERSISSSMKHADLVEKTAAVDIEEEPELKVNESMDVKTFESHDHVYVKIYIKDPAVLSNLKIYHNSNQLLIEGMPNPEARHVITLPSIVKMKESVSEYRDSYLQIKMKKRTDPQFTEVAVPPVE